MNIDKETLRQRLDIARIAEDCGVVRPQRGGNFRCWNTAGHSHGDKKPSCKLYPKTGTFHCFGCGNTGDVFDLWQQTQGVTLPEAIEGLARQYAPDLLNGTPTAPALIRKKTPAPAPAIRADQENQAAAFRPVFSEIYQALADYCGGLGAAGRAYLQSRGFDPDQLQDRFGLFELQDYNGAADHLKERFELADLRGAGVMNERGNLIFYRHRLLIPTLFRGQIWYFSARCLDGEQPKYINLARLPFPLFNADILRETPRNAKVYLVEGQFDAIALTLAGMPAVAFGGGGRFRPRWVSRFEGLRVRYVPDKDEAGEAVIDKLTPLFRAAGIGFKLAELPKDCKDAAELYQKYGTDNVRTKPQRKDIVSTSAPAPAVEEWPTELTQIDANNWIAPPDYWPDGEDAFCRPDGAPLECTDNVITEPTGLTAKAIALLGRRFALTVINEDQEDERTDNVRTTPTDPACWPVPPALMATCIDQVKDQRKPRRNFEIWGDWQRAGVRSPQALGMFLKERGVIRSTPKGEYSATDNPADPDQLAEDFASHLHN